MVLIMHIQFFKLFAIIMVIMSSSIYGQVEENASDGVARANEVLTNARKAIYGDRIDRQNKPVFISFSGTSYDKTIRFQDKNPSQTTEERMKVNRDFSIGSPQTAYVLYNLERIDASDVKFKFEITTIVNNDQAKRDTKTFVNGQKLDVGKLPSLEKTAFTKEGSAKSPLSDLLNISRAVVDKEVRSSLFPILLFNPLGKELKFKYIGIAKADEKQADVLELIDDSSETGAVKQTTRYFFDSESHLLMLVINTNSAEDIEKTTSTYLSDHKSINGILVPTKIKEETKIISKKTIEVMGMKSTGSEQTKITDLGLTKIEFDRNFSAKLFEIKN